MKVTCQSCQAKYSIADDKVRGKMAKIRCKKCGTTIIVNGTTLDAGTAPADSIPPQAHVAEEPWTVLVADDDQRTLTTEQVSQLFANGVVDLETLVWKDGMPDWLPVAQVEALRSAAEHAAASRPPETDSDDAATSVYNTDGQQHAAQDARFGAPGPAAGRPVAAQPAAAPVASAVEHVAAAAHAAVARPVAQPAAAPLAAAVEHVAAAAHAAAAHPAAQPVAAQPAAQPAAARTEPRRPGRGAADLFGAASATDDVLTSAAADPAAAAPILEKPTGARNENSVLFSLSALTGAPSGGAAFAAEEASSAADLRTLAGPSTGNGKGGARGRIDDIMNLGAGGLYNQALVAPALAPPPVEAGPEMDSEEVVEKKKKSKVLLLYATVGVLGVACVLLIGINLGSSKKDDAAPSASASAAPATSVAMAPTADPAAAPQASAAAPAEPTAVAPGTTAPKPAAERKEAPSGGEKPAPAAPTEPKKPQTTMDALRDAVNRPTPAPTAAPAAPAAPGAAFDRAAASSALSAIASSVQGCKKEGGPTGPGRVKVTFATSGNVTTAVIDGPPYQGTPTGGCIVGKFRGARVPPFSGDTVTAGKSFQIN
jgi:predicted Zn finger-like uncharacterized protein